MKRVWTLSLGNDYISDDVIYVLNAVRIHTCKRVQIEEIAMRGRTGSLSFLRLYLAGLSRGQLATWSLHVRFTEQHFG